MPPVGERVDNLEQILAEFIRNVGNAQMQTEREIREFKDEMQRDRENSKIEMKVFREEMRSFRDEMQRDRENSKIEMKIFREEMQQDRENSKIEMKVFREEMQQDRENFKNEMRNFRDEMQHDRENSKIEIKEFREEMQQDRENSKNEMTEFKEEMRKDRARAFKQWGEITNKMGTLAEDFVAPNVGEIAMRYFCCEEGSEEDFMVRRFKRKPKTKSKRREFDVIAVYDTKIILVEVKSTPRIQYIDDFAETLKEVYEYFPEYINKKIIPVFASLYLPDEVIAYLTKKNIFAMAIRDDMMDLMNFGEVHQARANT
ncbi:hypothetical protein [Candidatus Kuenenia stuttgartiensis]|uniref:DUF8196 domain-containing protein n=1 Tax=Kuenenia stuttgartiensis TaxID=174633 RepID=Q1Q4M1_KUEST|nr:hypothetical protein [Candidatus Kuenenia stuttgartiensis]MBE7547194.1 hypothetical protein [Planctomycetia bacterium]MCF6150695.1 hypothetical protein [Candidatus Kuenenia stuttgartiensis]CAJ74964.1 hypothetical protein kuste4202 [Candidatus Kuenenia stuttgartiensis]